MNRRRFLGFAFVAPLAALGTRVPEPAAPSFEDAHAAGFQDGLAAAENALIAQRDAGLKTWTELREIAFGPDPYGALAQRAVWDFDDMMAAQAASRPGVLYERFTQDPANQRTVSVAERLLEFTPVWERMGRRG